MKDYYNEREFRMVAIGGGTGLPAVLSGLKKYHGSIVRDLAALVTVADDGGSSGRLRDEYQILAPGDIRNCLISMAEAEPLMADLFRYRFEGKGELGGHNFGNLLLTALTHITGDFLHAIQYSSKILAVKGSIFPSTLQNVQLCAELEDGAFVYGESNISKSKKRIKKVSLLPQNCTALSDVVDAIKNADAIILGPGSLYTSIIPNLLVREITDSIISSRAQKIFVCNIMTQPGETTGYTVCDHIDSIISHSSVKVIDKVLVNSKPVSGKLLKKYEKEGASQVKLDMDRVTAHGIKVIEEDLLREGDVVRHDPEKLAKKLLDIISGEVS